MSEAWLSALPAFAVAAAALTAPGLVVLLAGWGGRRPEILFLAPAVSTAVVAVAAVAAPVLGLSWSFVPILLLTAVAAGIAFALRRWAGDRDRPRPTAAAVVAALGGLLLAGTVLVLQLTFVFVEPASISQTFDAIVHLNTVAFAVETGNASAFHIGATTDIPFYPNAWHAVTSLAATTTGAAVPIAVNATGIAIGAVAWPASCIALAAVLFRGRPAAMLSAAALSTAFGAFPILLLDFGVLYPNTMGYAILPAGIAAVWLLLRARGVADRTRSAVLLAVLCAGIGLGHPNAFLALFAFGAFIALAELLLSALRDRSRRTWIRHGAIAIVILAVGAGLWRYSRTGWEMSRWGPWQSTAQAFGEAMLMSPRATPITLAVSVLIVIGLIAVVRTPRHVVIAVPFAVAAFMFVLVSGTGVDNLLREMVTNPWYNDSYRLAALLPVAGIPVAVRGTLTVVDAATAFARRTSLPRAVRAIAAIGATLALFLVGAGPNVTRAAETARGSYVLDSGSALLTDRERLLIDRLPETTPEDAVIAGNPWTGVSLAYALGGREVVALHVFGERTDDESYLDERLRDIDDDPSVCEAVRNVGATHVIDFGDRNVFDRPDAGRDRAGLENLEASEHLILVDSEGDDARLFRIEGC